MNDSPRLTDLDDGSSGIVAGYDPQMPSGRRERLEDLGLIAETPVRRERSAPLGDPLLIRVRGAVLCLRKSEARHIRIRRNG